MPPAPTLLRPSWRRVYNHDWPVPSLCLGRTLMIATFGTKRANFGHSDKKWVSAIVFSRYAIACYNCLRNTLALFAMLASGSST